VLQLIAPNQQLEFCVVLYAISLLVTVRLIIFRDYCVIEKLYCASSRGKTVALWKENANIYIEEI
jgi:hypothetical protein